MSSGMCVRTGFFRFWKQVSDRSLCRRSFYTNRPSPFIQNQIWRIKSSLNSWLSYVAAAYTLTAFPLCALDTAGVVVNYATVLHNIVVVVAASCIKLRVKYNSQGQKPLDVATTCYGDLRRTKACGRNLSRAGTPGRCILRKVYRLVALWIMETDRETEEQLCIRRPVVVIVV